MKKTVPTIIALLLTATIMAALRSLEDETRC